ncbi:PRTRC system protein F [Burkholderia sp. MR1-5-21]
MFFDPALPDSSIAAGSAAAWQPPRAAAARRRPAFDLLTLPSFSTEVPGAVRLKWREDVHLSNLVLKHFQYGPLRAGDVTDPVDAGDAFQQAFFAWVRRQYGKLKRIRFSPVLLDAHAAREVLDYVGNGNNDDDPTPLFFSLELEHEWVYELGASRAMLQAAHPALLKTVMTAIARASARTSFVRLPDWFMYEFSCWYWEGDDTISDEDADKCLRERFGEDDESRKAYLPSEVRPVLCPDDVRPGRCYGRWSERGILDAAALRALRLTLKGMPRRICTEVLTLLNLMGESRKRDLFNVAYETNPVYALCSVVVDNHQFVGDLLDCHFENEGSSGDATTYSGFSRLESHPRSIRRQYAHMALAFRILTHLDRLLALVTPST